MTYVSTLFVTVLVQYNSSESSVMHIRSFLLLHSTGADLGGLLGGLAQPRAADFRKVTTFVCLFPNPTVSHEDDAQCA